MAMVIIVANCEVLKQPLVFESSLDNYMMTIDHARLYANSD